MVSENSQEEGPGQNRDNSLWWVCHLDGLYKVASNSRRSQLPAGTFCTTFCQRQQETAILLQTWGSKNASLTFSQDLGNNW